MAAPIPCPHCQAKPRIRRGYHWRKGTWTAECSNDINCPVWPITSNHPTPEAARAAWNSGTAFQQENLV